LVMRNPTSDAKLGIPDLIKSKLKRCLLYRAESVQRVHVLRLVSAVAPAPIPNAYVRDPVSFEVDSAGLTRLKKEWGLSDDFYWFAVLGAISDRKNIGLVLESLIKLADPRLALLVAGACDLHTLSRLKLAIGAYRERGGSVVIVDRLLADWEFDAAVAATDCIVVAHSNEGPSGLLGKAVAAGTRVVAAGAMSLKRDAEAAPEIAQWSELEVDSVSVLLESAAQRSEPILSRGPLFSEFTDKLLALEIS
jgi:hypothetical protein